MSAPKKAKVVSGRRPDAQSHAAPARKGTEKAAPAAAKKGAEKPGAISSLKKMLGMGKPQKAAPAAKGKAAAPVPAAKGKAAAAPAPAAKGKAATPAPTHMAAVKGKGKGAAPAAAPTGKGKKGEAQKPTTAELAASASQRLSAKPAQPEIAPGAPVCREVACELMATTAMYCRMHYIKNWKKIKRKEMILKEKKLNSYIEELVSKYPDKYIEAIRQDLASEKDFAKVIADLEIDESLDDFESVETESAEGIIDNLKRDFDDEGDVF